MSEKLSVDQIIRDIYENLTVDEYPEFLEKFINASNTVIERECSELNKKKSDLLDTKTKLNNLLETLSIK